MRLWLGRLLLLGALGAAGYWAWQLLFPSPEHVIRTRLAALAGAASISPNEGQLTKLAKVQKLVSFFSPDVHVTVDIPGRSLQTFDGPQEIQQAALGARAMLPTLTVEFLDIVVSLGPERRTAQAHLTATAKLPGEKIPEVQELEIGFKQVGRDWLINRVDTIKTLR